MERSIGVGVIGTGVMGRKHARLIRCETPGAHLVGVFDADADRARAVAEGATVFADTLSLIASDRIQAVIIASPDTTHADLTLACLKAGKAILCEKPLAPLAADALRVVEAEVGLGQRLIQVGYMRRFDAGYLAMKRIKDAGGVGAIVLLHNLHRNVRAPEWFTGAMAVTNAFVHEDSDFYARRRCRARVRTPDPGRHGRDQRPNSGTDGVPFFWRLEGLALRRPSHARPGRRPLLHTSQDDYFALADGHSLRR